MFETTWKNRINVCSGDSFLLEEPRGRLEKVIPFHLKKYIVEQDYSRYTPIDQAVWRYIMRQLIEFLSVHAHPCYVEGLKKTGIEADHIPNIQKMSEQLQKFGWQAVPVSGFIPPAAFMEMQSLGLLPIASDMRTISHLMYTPAPDIVHEAAGHAPILVDEAFAGYLKKYAQVARKAIISRKDLNQYEAIRVLSDMKEDPHSTPEQIREAEMSLNEVNRSISDISEAAILGRMNWWTAEYGLIGSLDNPRIFGAGLLSSVGEARACLQAKVKKIPFSLDCINYAYDITEQQPQLFVTPDFDTLGEVLEQLATTMAFRRGGKEGLEKIKRAETVNTVELNSGVQISGRLKNYIESGSEMAYLQFDGPSQLSTGAEQLLGHGTAAHPHGFGSPVGFLKNQNRCLSGLADSDLRGLGIVLNSRAHLEFQSGVVVDGVVTGWIRSAAGRLIILSFKDCTVKLGAQVLFAPDWGAFDMAVGSKVTSVFGGAADRAAYGETEDFVAKIIPRKQYSPLLQHLHSLYQRVRDLRERPKAEAQQTLDLEKTLTEIEENFPHEWLLRMEILEIGRHLKQKPSWLSRIELELSNLSERNLELRPMIQDGLRLAEA